MRDAVAGGKQSNTGIRTQIMAIREEMARLRLEGKQNTAEYEERRSGDGASRNGVKGTPHRTDRSLNRCHADRWCHQWRARIDGSILGGLRHRVNVRQGQRETDGGSTKMQSVMAVMMGVQQMSNTLHATS